MNQLAQIPETSPLRSKAAETQQLDQEIGAVAREAAASYQGMVEAFKAMYKCSIQEASAKTDDLSSMAMDAVRRPAEQVTWFDLHNLGEHSPELALQCWQSIKKHALEELQSGHRAAKTMEVHGDQHCWDRAQFLAIRDDLATEWQPRNGVERQLIDGMAHAQTAMLSWMTTLTTYTGLESAKRKRDIREQQKWTPQRMSEADAIEQAAAMFDRFNRIFLRTLRALRDLRSSRRPCLFRMQARSTWGRSS